MSRKCRHQVGTKSSTLETRVIDFQQPLYYMVCRKCGAHTGFYLTVTEAKARARAGYLIGGKEER